MASSHPLHEAMRSRNQGPSTLSSQVESCSECSRLNHQRPVKPLACGPDLCPHALREGTYIKEGDAIQFFSRSADAWLDGKVAQVLNGVLLRVNYQVGQYWISKTFLWDSEDILIPSATELCSEESDPMGLWSGLCKRWAEAKEISEKRFPEAYALQRAMQPQKEETKKEAKNLIDKQAFSPPSWESAAKQCGTELFHQTDEVTAGIILSTQRMKPGLKGLAGGGIYFATTEELTGHKAHAHGVILRAYVRLGKILTLHGHGDRQMTGNKLKNQGFDSVCIARKVSSGQECVVYDPAQVLYIERA